MNRTHSFLLYFFLLFTLVQSMAQQHQLSPNAEISVLTIGRGESLNDAFGHNVFRINDRLVGTDVVYGYGEYDFDTPNFYLKFAQGKLNYMISKESFTEFYKAYVNYDRTIEEQVLNLNAKEKQQLYDNLINNYKPENRRYLYDFFYDNCATRIRDLVETSVQRKLAFYPPKDFEPQTFRHLIHDQTGKNNWGSFGIDLALGSVIDREASPYEHLFLPKYIHAFFANAKLDASVPLVKKSTVLYERRAKAPSSSFFGSPLMVLGILSLIILFITYSDYKNNHRSQWLDLVLFTLTGVFGLLILFLWFGTDHTATAQNYNLLWAIPLNLFMLGQLMAEQPKNWFRRYLKFLIIMLILLTLHWILGIQVYAIGLIPLLVALFIRYLFLIYYYKHRAGGS